MSHTPRIRFFAEENHRSPVAIFNFAPSLSEDADARFLHEQARALEPELAEFALRLDGFVGCRSHVNVKSLASIAAKGARPSILARRPWHCVRHLRDCLRFRSAVHSIDEMIAVFIFFAEAAAIRRIQIVKFDVSKFFRPSVYGWRMIAIDFRLVPSGFLVEYYVTFHDLIAISDRLLHTLYEKWRNIDPDDLPLEQVENRSDDITTCSYTYSSWLFRSLSNDTGKLVTRASNVGRDDASNNPVANCRKNVENQIADTLGVFERFLSTDVEIR